MRKRFIRTGAALLAGVMAASSFIGVSAVESPKTIYAVSTSHLDTVWSWPLEDTISTFIPKTLRENFNLLEKYPDYQFNFEGAYRYQLMQEYYPEEFEKVKQYVASGQWNVAGSGLENGDVNTPSPEALFRNFLYGNNYFEDVLGQRSKDIYLPDCFGFGYALPSVAAHSNLLGFSTQKLSWGNTFAGEKLPFDVGLWKGPDGKSIIANINYNGYTSSFSGGLRDNSDAKNRLNRSPLNYIGMIYGPGGDRGGAPGESTVAALSKEFASNTPNNVNVIFASTDDMFKAMTPAERAKLETYEGEFLLKQHGAGGYTSRAISKRWNRRSELLGDAAERANVAASYMGASDYPTELFEEIWTRVIVHQFHDDIPGTSNSVTYKRSWNDYMVAIKQFAAEYQNGVAGVASVMDTRVDAGVPVVVNNPVAARRSDVVDAEVTLKSDLPYVRVYDDTGAEVAAQVLSRSGNTYKIAFMADVASMGYRAYKVVPSDTACGVAGNLSVSKRELSNEKYTVTIDANGDISSIIDKTDGDKELLNKPIRLGLFNSGYIYWAAWELNIDDYAFKKPGAYVGGTPEITIVENGPARVALKITRTQGESTYEQTVSLTAGGQLVTVDNVVDWNERGRFLKAEFDLTSSNPTATYDLGLGVIKRGNNERQKSDTSGQNKAEVPVQKWADLSAQDDSYGVSIINDCKYGMDKYNDSTLRLTLIHTPGNDYDHGGDAQAWAGENYGPAGMTVQEVGENRFAYAVYGHGGAAEDSDVQVEAEAFNQPMNAFQTESHAGALGKNYSFGSISNSKVLVRALKKAERSDEIIVRFNEGAGAAAENVAFSLGSGIKSFREVYASEEEVPEAERVKASIKDGKLVFDIGAYGVKTFALTLNDAAVKAAALKTKILDLPYNIDVYSSNANKTDGGFNRIGDAYAAELVPDTFVRAGVPYVTGSKQAGENNAVRAAGQTIQIPAGYNKLRLLAASTNGDKDAAFKVGSGNVTLNIADYAENVAAWDLKDLNTTGYVKEHIPALVTTHRHTHGADNLAATAYMFSYELDVTGATSVTLPADDNILIFAATAVNDENRSAAVASELHDRRARTQAAPNPSGVLFSAGFEDGDEMPRENYTTNQSNVSTIKCEVVNEPRISDSNILKMSGKDDSASGSFVYFTIYLNKAIKVTEGTTLSYKFYAGNELGRYTAIDMDFTTGSSLRDRSSAVDADGVRMHPSYAKGTVGEWVTVTCDLSACASNSSITKIMFAYDHPGDTGEFISYIDDLVIGSPEDPLQLKIDAAEALDRSLYTAASMASVDEALQLLKEIRAAEDASNHELDFAVKLLETSMSGLVKQRNGYEKINAWDYNSTSGVGIDKENGQPSNIGGVNSGAWVSYNALSFGSTGADRVVIDYSGWNTGEDAKAEVHLGDAQGELLATLEIPQTSTMEGAADWSKYRTVEAKLSKTLTGDQDITVVFIGSKGHVCNVKSFLFKEVVSEASLEKALRQARNVNRIDKTEASLAALDAAIAAAEKLLDAAELDLVKAEAAIDALNDAVNGLKDKKYPYQRVNAWEFDDSHDLSIDRDGSGQATNLGGVLKNAYAVYEAMDFGAIGADKVSINYAGWNTGGDAKAEVRLNDASGELLGTIDIPQTSTMQGGADWSKYQTATANLNRTLTGEQTICVVFRGSGSHVANVKYIQFQYTDPKAALEKEIADAKAIDRTDKTEASVKALDDAIAAAEKLVGDSLTSETAADAVATIKTAIKELVKDFTDELQTVLEEAKAVDRTGKTAESLKILDDAIEAAEKLAGDDHAPAEQVWKAVEDLRAAIAGLKDISNVVPGDMDGNGQVTIQDVMEACKVLARQSAGKAPTADEMLRGNLDGDDKFSIGDVMEICKILARKA
ncbi:MAG: carbohydrate-binding protein [Clostridiales bacterium]|nr:carbohydrate-binding protein [Clostridiales bacterium]